MTSVLQPWVMELPLRAQGTLLTGVRGCDLTPKEPLDSTERQLAGYLRYCCLVPADPREIGVPGAWFQLAPPTSWRPSELGHYPHHYVMHLVHCYEVVAYCHPDPGIRSVALDVYLRFVRSMHLNHEPRTQMDVRLTEDRIESGEVVS